MFPSNERKVSLIEPSNKTLGIIPHTTAEKVLEREGLTTIEVYMSFSHTKTKRYNSCSHATHDNKIYNKLNLKSMKDGKDNDPMVLRIYASHRLTSFLASIGTTVKSIAARVT